MKRYFYSFVVTILIISSILPSNAYANVKKNAEEDNYKEILLVSPDDDELDIDIYKEKDDDYAKYEIETETSALVLRSTEKDEYPLVKCIDNQVDKDGCFTGYVHESFIEEISNDKTEDEVVEEDNEQVLEENKNDRTELNKDENESKNNDFKIEGNEEESLNDDPQLNSDKRQSENNSKESNSKASEKEKHGKNSSATFSNESNDLSEGQSSKEIKQLKKDLNKLGFKVTMNYPNRYGPSTTKTVKEFQDYYGMKETGTADEKTLDKLETLLSDAYMEGQRGKGIKKLKEDLNKIGIKVTMNYPDRFGPSTTRAVKEFQKKYGLKVSGVAEGSTLSKVASELPDDLSEGQSSKKIKKLKQDLNKLGFIVTMNYPERYGPGTTKTVKEFQNYYGIKATGTADEKTLDKLKTLLSDAYMEGQRGKGIKKLKEDLNNIGIKVTMNYPNRFGPSTTKAVKKFQKKFNLKVSGVAEEKTLKKIEQKLKTNKESKYNISLKQALDMQMKTNPQTDKNYAYIIKTRVKNGTTSTKVNVRVGPGTNHKDIGQLKKNTDVNIIGESNGWYIIDYNHSAWVTAKESDVKQYLNPKKYQNDEKDKFQFLDLSKHNITNSKSLNKVLSNKGILKGHGNTFLEAANKEQVNEIYLISHSILETGHGTSKLSSGNIEVGKISKNKWVSIHPENTYIVELVGDKWKIKKDNNFKVDKAKNIKKTYNMFGVGALDQSPNVLGSVRAYQEGWNTPKKAIIGGSKFISEKYVKVGQDTIYKMRWNPSAMESYGYATHQYATDIGWAKKQVNNIYNLYQELDSYTLYFDIPVYK